MRRPKGGKLRGSQHSRVTSGIRRVLATSCVLGALRLAACGDVVGDEIASTFDLPNDVADTVYAGHERGRAIAFVRDGTLFVVAQDQGIVFALEPAHGDTPPLVMAIAQELTTDLAAHQDPMPVALTNMKVPESD